MDVLSIKTDLSEHIPNADRGNFHLDGNGAVKRRFSLLRFPHPFVLRHPDDVFFAFSLTRKYQRCGGPGAQGFGEFVPADTPFRRQQRRWVTAVVKAVRHRKTNIGIPCERPRLNLPTSYFLATKREPRIKEPDGCPKPSVSLADGKLQAWVPQHQRLDGRRVAKLALFVGFSLRQKRVAAITKVSLLGLPRNLSHQTSEPLVILCEREVLAGKVVERISFVGIGEAEARQKRAIMGVQSLPLNEALRHRINPRLRCPARDGTPAEALHDRTAARVQSAP